MTIISYINHQTTVNIIIGRWISEQNQISTKEAEAHFEKLKKNSNNGTQASKGLKQYFVNVFRHAGLELSLDGALAKFKEFC